MKRYVYRGLLLAVLLSSGGYAVADQSQTVTVEDAVQRAVSGFPVREADEAVKASRARVAERQSGYYPSISASASYTRLSPDAFVAFPGLGMFQFYPENNYDYHLSLHHTLLDFGKVASSVALARSSADSAAYTADLARENMAFDAIRLFYTLLLLQQSVQVQEQQIATLNDTLALTRKKVQSGTATSFDALTTQVKVAEADNQRIELASMLTKQQIAFKRLLALDEKTTLELKGQFSREPVVLDEPALVSKALQDRSEMKLTRAAATSTRLQLHAAKLEFAPTVSLYGTYGFKNGFLLDIQEVQNNYTAGAALELPLFDGFRTRNQVKEAVANIAANQARLNDVTDTIASEVRQAITDVNASREKLDSGDLHVQLANEALSQAKVRYASGVITNLDLLNAETSLAQAHLLRLQALYEYVLSKNALKKAIGMKLWLGEGK